MTLPQKDDRMLTIETCIDVNVPVEIAYDQWRQFEKFPEFMEGVNQGKQINASRLHGKAEIAGERVVTFHSISDVMSTVVVQFTCPTESFVEHVTDGVEVLSVRVHQELKRLKAFIEPGGQVKGDWLTSLPYHAFF